MAQIKKTPCKIEIDQDLCAGCGECVRVCGSKVLGLDESTGKATVLGEGICCGHCFAVCSAGAITMHGAAPAAAAAPAAPAPAVAYEDMAALLRERRAVRHFRGEKVSRAVVNEILADCRYAPTACNTMDVAYIVVEDAATLDAIREMTVEALKGNEKFAERAKRLSKDASCVCGSQQLLIVEGPLTPPFCDWAIALEHFELIAQTRGIRTCWAGFVSIALQSSPALRQFLRDKGAARGPEGAYGYYAMMFGYPEENYVRVPPRPNPPTLWI